MIVGVGVDVVEVARLARALERTPTLRGRLFTPGEQLVERVESLAARFAAKAYPDQLGLDQGKVTISNLNPSTLPSPNAATAPLGAPSPDRQAWLVVFPIMKRAPTIAAATSGPPSRTGTDPSTAGAHDDGEREPFIAMPPAAPAPRIDPSCRGIGFFVSREGDVAIAGPSYGD